MEPNPEWTEHWRLGLDPGREAEISRDLLAIFDRFWRATGVAERSKSTRNRYAGGLQALGAYLVEKAVTEDEDGDKGAEALLRAYLDPEEGPLVHPDDEEWQRGVDVVCKKLYRFLF